MGEKSPEPVSVALAQLLKERGLTQAELCHASGVSRGAVSRYLSGHRGMRLDSRGARAIEKIALSLGVSPDYFREYRAWRIRELAALHPILMDDFYDLVLETARLRGLLEDGPDDAKK